MEKWFEVNGLETERLLFEWQWLFTGRMCLVAKNVFGDLFLRDDTGTVFWLNATVGRFDRVADSEREFREIAVTTEKRKEWFAEPEMLAYRKRGMSPGTSQCIGFSVPAVFREGGTPETAYVANLYDYVSFLGGLHRQLSALPNGSRVQLRVNPPKPVSADGT
jgi:hypothetical protein